MAEKRLAGTKILMVIAPEQFRDEELLVPKEKFEEAGAAVTVVSTRSGEAKGMLGAKFNANKTLSEVKAQDFQAIVVVGGMGSPEFLWDDSKLHGLVKELNASGKVVAAICLSGAVLANAGILKGKRATVWPMDESLEALEKGSAQYVEQPVVQDGKIITANGPEAAQEFGETIIAELSKVKV